MPVDEYTPPACTLSEAEQQEIFKESPKGTWTILFIYGVLFVLAFLYFWFGLFVPAGAVR